MLDTLHFKGLRSVAQRAIIIIFWDPLEHSTRRPTQFVSFPLAGSDPCLSSSKRSPPANASRTERLFDTSHRYQSFKLCYPRFEFMHLLCTALRFVLWIREKLQLTVVKYDIFVVHRAYHVVRARCFCRSRAHCPLAAKCKRAVLVVHHIALHCGFRFFDYLPYIT